MTQQSLAGTTALRHERTFHSRHSANSITGLTSLFLYRPPLKPIAAIVSAISIAFFSLGIAGRRSVDFDAGLRRDRRPSA
jgi:hypothetical protein